MNRFIYVILILIFFSCSHSHEINDSADVNNENLTEEEIFIKENKSKFEDIEKELCDDAKAQWHFNVAIYTKDSVPQFTSITINAHLCECLMDYNTYSIRMTTFSATSENHDILKIKPGTYSTFLPQNNYYNITFCLANTSCYLDYHRQYMCSECVLNIDTIADSKYIVDFYTHFDNNYKKFHYEGKIIPSVNEREDLFD